MLGNKSVAPDPGGGSVAGGGAGGVPRGGHREFSQAVMSGHGDGQGKPARFEASRGIGALFFQENVWITAAAQHGRPGFSESDGLYFRKHRSVTPPAGPI